MRRLGWCAAVCVVVAVGCSSATRERLKHFFFEVPDQTEADAAAGPPPAAVLEPIPVDRPALQYASAHPPYEDRQCDACHDAAKRMAVQDDFLDTCASCHERYFDEDEVAHFPVAEKECRGCHVLHRSAHPALGKVAVFDMCSECHDSDDLPEEACGTDLQHCTKCHDAHFGEDTLLRPGVRGTKE